MARPSRLPNGPRPCTTQLLAATDNSNPNQPQPNQQQATLEMISMAAIGIVLVATVVFDLATDDLEPSMETLSDDVLETVTRNVLDVALPQSATDVIAVSLGETMGGIVGMAATTLVGAAVNLRGRLLGLRDEAADYFGGGQPQFWSQALANADYFLTRAAAVPILVASGLDPLWASLGGVLIATIPYEAVKYQARMRRFRKSEEELLQELLREEQDRFQRGNMFVRGPMARPRIDTATLQPVLPSPELDIPDFVADVIQWLEYDVLKTTYSGSVEIWGMPVTNGGLESALFGVLAAVSSQLYLDALYQTTNWGPADESTRARNRTMLQLLTTYSTRCLQTAALFGVYESVQQPVKNTVSQVLSGGWEGCWGSSDYQTCVDTYLWTNDPWLQVGDETGISFQLELQGLGMALGNFLERLQTEGGDWILAGW